MSNISTAAAVFSNHSPDQFGYRLVKRAELASSEVEDANVSTIEVMVGWGDNVLHVAHLAPKAAFAIGEDADFAVPAEKLGAQKVVLVENGSLNVPADARGNIDFGDARMTVEEARAAGRITATLSLTRGIKARLEIGGFTVTISAVAAGKRVAGDGKKRRRVLGLWVGSALLHVGIVGALMMSPGASLDDDAAGLDKSTAAYLMQMQKNHADKEAIEEREAEAKDSGDKGGHDGKAHAGPPGMAGDMKAKVTGGHLSVKGPEDTKEVKLAKTHALIQSGQYGAIGALSAVFGANTSALTSFDGGDMTLGRDPADFNGNLTGDHPGNSFGVNGLALSGIDAGGGGFCVGGCLGMSTFGEFGTKGPGTGWETGSPGKPLGGYKGKTIKMPETTIDQAGKLPQEVVKRIVRANFPRFRACYEVALKKDPGLRGTVITRFIIDTTGATESASMSGGTMNDGGVKSCVRGVFASLSYPEPESGKVMVTYPLDFDNN